MSSKLTITLDGKDDIIDVKSFVEVVRSTIAALDLLEESPGKWAVGKVSHSSPLNLEVLGIDTSSSNKVGMFLAGVEILENEGTRPSYFNDGVLKNIRKMAKPLSNGMTTLSFSNDEGLQVNASSRLEASASKYLAKKEYYAHTELEGELGEITAHGGKAEFCIFDPITDHKTVCRFDFSDAEAVGAHLTHRIRVEGKTRYDSADNPVLLIVDNWTLVGEPIDISDLHLAKFKLKEGTDSADLIRKLRDLDG
ncbi:MAG: hypothetical protein AB2598_18190 [Candidatus Thiodiazotropha sp.]